MIKFLLFFCSLSLCIGSPAAGSEGELILIKGHVSRENVVSVVLYGVSEGRKIEYASTKLDANNNFAFALPSVREGFYYLSDQRRNAFTRIYLKRGDKLQLELGQDDYKVISGSDENKLLQQWYTQSAVITTPAFNWMRENSTYTSFFPALESFLPGVPGFKTRIRTKNQVFNQLMKMAVDTDVEHAAMYYLLTPKSVHPKKEQYPSFYSSIIVPGKYKSAQLLELGDAVDLLSRYATFNLIMNNPGERPKNILLHNTQLFGNDTIKGAYVASSLRYKSFEELEQAIAPVKQYLVTDSMQAAYFRAIKSVADFKKGSPAFNFKYENVKGGELSMNDLKGKVVLIDVWATWCGPCKVELPHLKTLEEAFKGKNVEFVSISVDVEKDKEKWRTFIKEHDLGGTQLFASGWSDITKYYSITGIPRFMVFDQEGKIVTVNAPRPSEKELKELLETTLQGK